MDLDTFERVARRAFEAIPSEYREGIDGLVISPDAEPHPTLPEIYTLGYCDTEAYPSDWAGPETVRSVIRLYHGSFQKLAALDPDFDWEAEIHETVEHEVRHHLEWLAGQDQLGDVDYAMDESFKRGQGLEWDPWYYQRGEPVGHGAFVVEDQVYVEQEWTTDDFEGASALEFWWRGGWYAVEPPDELGDLHFIWITGGVETPPRFLELVLVRKRTWWEGARQLFSSSPLRILESEAVARALPPPPDG